MDFEQPRPIIPVCNHILESGRLCRGPARRRQRFCRHHFDLRARRLRSGRAERHIRLRLRMYLLQHRPPGQLATARVRYALAAGRLEPPTARQIFWGLGLINSNIRYVEQQAQWEREERDNAPYADSQPLARNALSPSSSIKYKQTLGTQAFTSRYVVSS